MNNDYFNHYEGYDLGWFKDFVDDFNTHYVPTFTGITDLGLFSDIDLICQYNGKPYGVELKTRLKTYNDGYFIEPKKLNDMRKFTTVSGIPCYYVNLIEPTHTIAIWRFDDINKNRDNIIKTKVKIKNKGRECEEIVDRYILPLWMASTYNMTSHLFTPTCLKRTLTQ